MKRKKYKIIMAAVLLTAACFILISRIKSKNRPSYKAPQTVFAFADKAESEGDYSYVLQKDASTDTIFAIYRTDGSDVVKVYEKKYSAAVTFWKYGARIYIVEYFREKQECKTMVYDISDPQKPIEKQSYVQKGGFVGANVLGEKFWVVTKQKTKMRSVRLVHKQKNEYRAEVAVWPLKKPNRKPQISKRFFDGDWYQKVGNLESAPIPYDRELNLQVLKDSDNSVTLCMQQADAVKKYSRKYSEKEHQESIVVDNRRGYIGLCEWNCRMDTYQYLLLNYDAEQGFREVWHSKTYDTPIVGQIRANAIYLFSNGQGSMQELP